MNWNWLAVAAGGALGVGVYAMTKEVEPKSLPFTLPTTKLEFTDHVYRAIDAALPQLSIQSRSLVIAHAAYESGWGKATAAKQGNLFNITAGSSWTGAVVAGGDKEYSPDGSVRSITQRFRAYPSLEVGLQDYMTFLGTARYAAAKAQLLAGDAQFVVTLGSSGYYTLPIAQYWANYRSILQSVLGSLQDIFQQSIPWPANAT